MKQKEIIKEMLDLDYRISSKFGLPYKSYFSSDKESLQLLDLVKGQDFSLEWDSTKKQFKFIVYDGLFGFVVSGNEIKEVIRMYFKQLL